MIKEYVFNPQGVCSREMVFTYDDETKTLIKFEVTGGCGGNLKGIKALIEGEKIENIISKLNGIKCGFKNTSCPDQISKGLSKIL